MPVLNTSATFDTRLLSKYPYFQTRTHSTPSFQSVHHPATKASNDEWLCRDRRTILFSACAGLLPCNVKPAHEKLEKGFSTVISDCDHVSYWQDEMGVPYLLVEPYRDSFTNRELNLLHHAGIVTTEIPINLSPYCGRWDSKIGAMPATRSFLATNIVDKYRLEEIEKNLSEEIATAPAWNDTSKIKHY